MPITAAIPCPFPCGNGGWCNRQIGQCHCPTGWGGVDCQARDSWPCNLPKAGWWSSSVDFDFFLNR